MKSRFYTRTAMLVEDFWDLHNRIMIAIVVAFIFSFLQYQG